MNRLLLVILVLCAMLVACIFWYHWDAAKNRGRTWGYWGEFNTVSNALARLPGVTILKPWWNPDAALEEFGFDVVADGKQISLTFGERDPVRALSGQELEEALKALIRKRSPGSRSKEDSGAVPAVRDDGLRAPGGEARRQE